MEKKLHSGLSARSFFNSFALPGAPLLSEGLRPGKQRVLQAAADNITQPYLLPSFEQAAGECGYHNSIIPASIRGMHYARNTPANSPSIELPEELQINQQNKPEPASACQNGLSHTGASRVICNHFGHPALIRGIYPIPLKKGGEVVRIDREVIVNRKYHSSAV